ncbi:hypothetical protein [Nocardia pseudovaccinii]|uniref:hypothetical protein n=1 Tax=Nocardia pseudovaccinii TaxID=189540 RepID=UPI0007A47F9B|nr:hypothetical protein [Nocardia pseudovaccinii]
MPIMNNPEVPPAVHVHIERNADAIRPIGPLEVTVTTELVDKFSSGARQLISRSAPVRDEGDPPGPVRDEGGPPTKDEL